MEITAVIVAAAACLLPFECLAQATDTPEEPDVVFPGADEQTPSYAQYSSWINNTNEGSTEVQTLIDLNAGNILGLIYAVVPCVSILASC